MVNFGVSFNQKRFFSRLPPSLDHHGDGLFSVAGSQLSALNFRSANNERPSKFPIADSIASADDDDFGEK